MDRFTSQPMEYHTEEQYVSDLDLLTQNVVPAEFLDTSLGMIDASQAGSMPSEFYDSAAMHHTMNPQAHLVNPHHSKRMPNRQDFQTSDPLHLQQMQQQQMQQHHYTMGSPSTPEYQDEFDSEETTVRDDCNVAFTTISKEGGEPATLFDVDGNALKFERFTCDADKGFRFLKNHGIICHKKNHFQVSVTLKLSGGKPAFVLPSRGSERLPLDTLELYLYGVKSENKEHRIGLVQSSIQRSKKDFEPIAFNLDDTNMICYKVGRMHFTTTTQNNMRKRGRPNPDQRYFNLLVSVNAKTTDGQSILLRTIESADLIVRASNPMQFTQHVETWATGGVPNSIQHQGKVGINFAGPEEALVLGGNCKIMGDLYQPSDKRIKENIAPVNTRQQLQHITDVPIYNYDYTDAWKAKANIDGEERPSECGVLAQELQAVVPHAVKVTQGTHALNDGTQIDNILMVKKDRLAMEMLGATQELAFKCDALREQVEAAEKECEQLQAEVDAQQQHESGQFQHPHQQTQGVFSSVLSMIYK